MFAEVRAELARVRESVGSVIAPLQDTIKRLTQQIEAAERRLVHIPESSLSIVLDEIKRMKAERDEVQVRLNDIKKVAGEPASIDDLEADARKEIEQLPELLRSPDVIRVRNALAGYVEKVEIWPDKKARLYVQPVFMKQLGMGRVSIPS